MKPILPTAVSNKNTAKKLFLFCAMLSISARLFAQAPIINSFSPASGAAGTLVTINGANLGSPTAFSIGRVTALVINNTGSVLTGFVMPGAVTGAISLSTGGGTATGSGNFTVTPTLRPAVQQGGKLVGTGNKNQAKQGFSVAVSADGNTAIAGGYIDNSDQGAVWVYTRSGGAWSQQGGKLVGTGNTGTAQQGYSVALSADGNTAIVGGPTDNSSQGAAWVFTRSGSAWGQQGGILVGTGNTGPANQGSSVSLSADGNTAIVGGYNDNSNQGAAWVYTRSGGVWGQQGSKLVGTGNTGAAAQGNAVSLSADGNTAIVGGNNDSNGQGAAWVYTRSGGVWSQQGGILVGTGNIGPAGQGASVSLSADGNKAMVGGLTANSSQGAAWVYTRTGGAWNQQGGKLAGTGNTGASFQGISVSLSADGNTAIVGGYGDNGGQGALWVYTRSGGVWAQQGAKLVGTGNTGTADQGYSAALSADGNTAIAGGFGDNSNQGAAWAYTVASTDAALSALTLSSGTLSPTFSSGTTTYTATVTNATTSITITPTTNNPKATVTVNSASASTPVNLNVGPNPIPVTVTAQDGTTKITYTVTVTRVSTDATLSALSLSSGTLNPTFSSGTTTYTATVTNATTSITITPITNDPNATVAVNNAPASTPVTLNVGPNPIAVKVTAQDGSTQITYTVTVTRLSNDATLSNLIITPVIHTKSGVLTPAFATGTTIYTASVIYDIPSVSITPTTNDVNATVTVNNTAVTSGTASGQIALNVGDNVITILVTAQDGTPETYTITVTRAPSYIATLSALKISPGALSPAFGATTINYTSSVIYGVTTATVTPTTSDANATVKVNGATVASGTPSGPIALNPGASNPITISVTAQDGKTIKIYTINITRAGSYIATLSALKLSSGTFTPGFGAGTTSYSASVSSSTASVTVTPTTSDINAAVKVNGTAVTSGTASGAIALNTGPNTITTIVTAQDGKTTKTYTLTVTRGANANLASLKLSAGTLNPVFSSGITSYTASVIYSVASITVTPTSGDPAATVTVNGAAVNSGTASAAILLNIGPNTITTIVTASDGVTSRTYTITVTRAPSYIATLSNLKLSSGTLSPAFGAGTVSYTATVPNTTASITVTPSTSDPNATVTVNGTGVTSGSPSGAIVLSPGANAITTVVTAQDGKTTKTYAVTVTRMGPGANPDETVSASNPTDSPQLAEDNIVVHQGISPNGDGINDFFQIDNIANYPDNKLTIINRNGLLVYEAKGYDNSARVFDGHSNKNGEMQLPGTYFYSLDYTAKGIVKHKTGFLMLKY